MTPHSALVLRDVYPQDADFLLALYASTRADEMALVAWDDAQKEGFLKMQLDARTRHYAMQYPQADDKVIVVDGNDVGRLIVSRGDTEYRLIDISILAEYRGRSTGTVLTQALLGEAAEAGLPVRLQVEKDNPRAERLYRRLGFTKTGEDDLRYQMEWRAPLNDDRTDQVNTAS